MTNIVVLALVLIAYGENATDKTISSHNAVGRYQIRYCVVQDVNRLYHKHYTLRDMQDPIKAQNCAMMWLVHYRRVYKITTAETLARCWRCGPTGALKRHEGFWYVKRAKERFREQKRSKDETGACARSGCNVHPLMSPRKD